MSVANKSGAVVKTIEQGFEALIDECFAIGSHQRLTPVLEVRCDFSY